MSRRLKKVERLGGRRREEKGERKEEFKFLTKFWVYAVSETLAKSESLTISELMQIPLFIILIIDTIKGERSLNFWRNFGCMPLVRPSLRARASLSPN